MVNYVELSRNFVPLAEDQEPDLSMGPLWGAKYGGWLSWAEVLDHPRVVLLAEAQSGKTEEFKHAAAGLNKRGLPAFYATIEQLAEGRLGLSPAERHVFDTWKTGAGRAWFFLDSVDEARLSRKKFDDALRYLAGEIGPRLDRVSILVSCRVSDWKGKSDRLAMLEIVPVPSAAPIPAPPSEQDCDSALLDPIFAVREAEPDRSEKKEERPELLVVRLVPLTSDQRRILATANGIQDVDTFMEAIERQGIDVLAERPGDMLELVQFWAEHKRFGTLREMTEAGVTTKLSEPDKYRPDNSDLPLSKAREGAERLAAAMTLAKTLTLVSPGQEPDPTLASGALEPHTVLPEWTPAEINALLRRGIFAPSTYGRVRFHHRSTQEYLTACWLKRLIDNGCQLSEIFTLLFAERYGIETVVPSLRSVAAWLALYYPDIRDEIIRREPLTLLTYGDPAALSIEARAAVLLKIAEKHAAGEIADDRVDRRAVGMFASPDLSDAVHRAWMINSRSDFRVDLIRLVGEGKITGCISLAEGMANDDKAPDFHRVAALDALVACRADSDLQRIAAKLVRNAAKVRRGLASDFAQRLFPNHLSVSDLLTLIDKSRTTPDPVEGFGYEIEDLWHSCPLSDRLALISGLAEICGRPPFVNDYHRVALRQEHLARHLGGIAYDAVSTLGDTTPPTALVRLLAVAERAERYSRSERGEPTLDQLIQQNPAVQRALFWYDVEEVRRYSKHSIEHWDQVHFGGPPLWELGAADLPWLRHDLQSKALHDDRRVALSAIASLLGPKLKAEAKTLRSLIGGDQVLRRELDSYLRPKSRPATRRLNQILIKQRKEQEARRARDEASWRDFRDKLRDNPTVLSDPTEVATPRGFVRLHNLSEWLRRKTGQDRPTAVCEWRLLIPAFSSEVAEAYRDGMKALWRLTAPERPVREPGGRITVKWTTIESYAAIGLEARENPQFATALTNDEVHRAVQHACLSEQGYPEWLDLVVSARPELAAPLLLDAFREEWLSEGGPSYVLHHFSQNGAVIHPRLQNGILDIIEAIEPKQLEALDRGLDIVRNCILDDEQHAILRRVAARRFDTHKRSRPLWAARYIALLLLLNGSSAAATLIDWLQGQRHGKRKTVTITVLGLLFGDHRPLVAGSLARIPPEALGKLVLFAYREIRPEEDNIHEGVYTPDSRDHAESARNAILKALVDSDGPDAFEEMMRLAAHPALRTRRIRFLELARYMAERDADIVTWRPSETIAFERDKILPITTAPQLYGLVQSVIREIGWEFDNADASARAILETARDETAVQEWLASELRLRAKGRYHVSRELEVAEGNLPDIVVSATSALIEVAVEAKHGGKGWSTRQLEGALRDQLVGDYLRPATRRYGVFVVTNHKTRGWTHPGTGKRLTFPEMITYLDSVAAKLRKCPWGDVAVAVIGIDAVKKARTRSSRQRKTPVSKKTPSKLAKRRGKVTGRRTR